MFVHPLLQRLSIMKVLSTKHPTHVANGLPQVPPTPLHLSPPSSPPPSTLTIEIDPTQRPPRPLRRSDPLGNFCLPSPLQSILGPKRTLSVLSDSAVTGSQRPVRKVTSHCHFLVETSVNVLHVRFRLFKSAQF